MSSTAVVPEPRAGAPHGPLPLVDPGRADLAATVVLATRPAPVLPFADQRLLARFVENVDRRLLLAASGPVRDGVMDRLSRVVAVAADVPVGDGVALLASEVDGALLHLREPVRDRAVVGAVPDDLELGVRHWPGDPLALVVVGPARARLLTLRHGLLREAVDGRFPLRRDPSLPLTDHLARVDDHLAAALGPDLPVVVAGTEELALAFRDRSRLGELIVGVLPGDQAQASPATLLTLAQHLPVRLTSSQRRAIAELTVARLHGRVVAGPEAVRAALPSVADPHVVVEASILDDDITSEGGRLAEGILLDALAGLGRVTIVPSGRLHAYGGIALVTAEVRS